MTDKVFLSIVITHAAFDEHRRESVERVRESAERALKEFAGEGGGHGKVCIERDEDRVGSLVCFLDGMRRALTDERVTHVLRLADDTPLYPGAGHLLRLLISRQSLSPIDLVVNTDHPGVKRAAEENAIDHGFPLYESVDGGSVGVTLWPRQALTAYLEWRERWLDASWADDRGVNAWVVAEGRRILHTGRSLVAHLPVPSLEGHEGERAPLYPLREEEAEGWRAVTSVRVAQIGRTYNGIHREILFGRKGFREARAVAAAAFMARECERAGGLATVTLTSDAIERVYRVERHGEDYLTPALIERVYRVERHGEPLDDKLVAFATPAFRGLHCEVAIAMRAAEAALRDAGYRVAYILTPGHSLVTRARHRICHLFLTSPATRMLWWDDDVVPVDPSCVVRMVKSGYHIVAGGYPLRGRDGSAVACNPLVGPDGLARLEVKEDGTAAVRDAATGFMMVTRECLVNLMALHPDRMYMDTAHGEFRYAPMWDLFSTFIDPGEPPQTAAARRDPSAPPYPTYRSEDYGFCSLAREAGFEVRVMMGEVFEHHGEAVYKGSPAAAWGKFVKSVG